MPRSVNHVASKAKRTRILKLTKGYYGARKNVWTVAKNTWFGGVGVGWMNYYTFIIIAVFISGLMVGRTPREFF